jgi:hypothetical protein
MHDIGGIVWVILVVLGVISSIRNNMRKAARARGDAKAPVQPPANVRQWSQPPPAVAAPAIPAAVAAPAPSVPIPSGATDHPATQGRIGTASIRGMFEGPATLIRAIVAAEVLGPPKSLQERTIWSPRHNEPSI